MTSSCAVKNSKALRNLKAYLQDELLEHSLRMKTVNDREERACAISRVILLKECLSFYEGEE